MNRRSQANSSLLSARLRHLAGAVAEAVTVTTTLESSVVVSQGWSSSWKDAGALLLPALLAFSAGLELHAGAVAGPRVAGVWGRRGVKVVGGNELVPGSFPGEA